MRFITATALALAISGALAIPTEDRITKRKWTSGVPYTEGMKFMLDGESFLFAGTNAYWLPFINVSSQIQTHHQSRDTNCSIEPSRCGECTHTGQECRFEGSSNLGLQREKRNLQSKWSSSLWWRRSRSFTHLLPVMGQWHGYH